ncbi:TIGR02444 family protein [Phenylobacterium sp.]|uniref:TIGR02444 family protein n=1 Tax=Phenylobacterium sp. TaxID=1871053 RepID=UPI002731AF31|nr:TIGR02444 family protein [Phenylobacterium sp.]MDP1617587.1 TIGR02444 family protein [Phenylobacterium sp.]MDP1988455.1 TIGR02444 family protein [Phenylobacterium sp.]
MGLWNWAVDTYGRPGVAEAALALQDDHGQNVPLLLWAAFARTTDPAALDAAAALARAWEAAAILPLRAARRALKAPLPPTPDATREALRAQVKAAELAAERRLLEALETIDPGQTPLVPLSDALAAAGHAWDPALDPADLAALARVLA